MAEDCVTVNVGPCRCIGGPHTSGDEVYLAPEASMTLGLRSNGAIGAAGNDTSRLETLLGRVFVEEGITGWTFLEDDLPVPVTPATIERLLPWGRGGSDVSERANDLYSEAVLAPLVRRSQAMSKPGPTGVLTSVTRPSRRERQNSSKSSSPVPSETPA
jgi:hypothetical protein